MSGTAIEIFVQQHHRPHRHPQGAFRDHARGRRRRHNAWDLGTRACFLVTGPLDAPNVGLHLHFDNIAGFDTRKRRQRLATLRAVLGRLAQIMHFHHDGQGRAITAAMSWRARLLAPLSSRSHSRLAKRLGTSGFLALLAVETLVEVAYLRFKGLHLRLQGRLALEALLVLRPPIVSFPLEGDIILLRQHHRLLGEGCGALGAHRCRRRSGDGLWLSLFHKLMLYQLLMESPIFFDGYDGMAEYLP